MYCTKCGTQNVDTAVKCVQCGEALRPLAPPQAVRIPNYLVHAILCTLLCCLPLGIVAIVYAAQVNTKAQAGDLAGAQQASEKAKLFSWISFGVGLVGIVLYFLLVFAGAIADG